MEMTMLYILVQIWWSVVLALGSLLLGLSSEVGGLFQCIDSCPEGVIVPLGWPSTGDSFKGK